MSADSDVVPQSRLLPVSGRTWAVVIVLGMVGQLAWTVENMYLNVFIYNTISTDPTVIAVTVAASAIAATLATMLIGAASDRARTRRPFIAIGYVLWGITTALFGLVRQHTWGTRSFGYKRFRTRDELGAAIVRLHDVEIVPAIEAGVAATVYTQLADVEDEVNGLVTCDRRLVKVDEAARRAVTDRMRAAAVSVRGRST